MISSSVCVCRCVQVCAGARAHLQTYRGQRKIYGTFLDYVLLSAMLRLSSKFRGVLAGVAGP